MSGDDEIEKLLREIDATSGGAPAAKPSAAPARTGEGRSGGSPLTTGLVAGVVCGVGVGATTLIFSWLPLVDNPFSSGAGAFIGAFLTGTVVSWRSKR